MIPLVKMPSIPILTYEKPEVYNNGVIVYAMQQYLKGKIGAACNYLSLIGEGSPCHQCEEFTINLIKWLSTPLTPQELEEIE